jgi:transcription elongation factor Elf1
MSYQPLELSAGAIQSSSCGKIANVEGPYTTLTVDAYNTLVATIQRLRSQVQEARMLIERKDLDGALALLRVDVDESL